MENLDIDWIFLDTRELLLTIFKGIWWFDHVGEKA